MRKKVMIVIEETGDEGQFNVFMAGDVERLDGKTPLKDLGVAEFWASKLFQVCTNTLTQAGVIKSEIPLGARNN